MKNSAKNIGLIVLPMLLLISSCSMEKRVHRKGFHVSSSLFKNNEKFIHKKRVTQIQEIILAQEVKDNNRFTKASEPTEPKELISNRSFNNVSRLIRNKANGSEFKSSQKNAAIKSEPAIQRKSLIQIRKGSIKKNTSGHIDKNAQRKTAMVTGASLLLMAVLAGVSMPALGTVMASIGLVGIFLLDLVVSFGVVKYHKKKKPKLAKASGLLRILYTAVLGVAVGYHIAGSVSMFNMLWGIGLILFGIHLITLAFVYDNEGGKRWIKYLIKSLLFLAGIGYSVLYVGLMIVANPIVFEAFMEAIFIVPMILGEMFYALWMLIKGGRSV